MYEAFEYTAKHGILREQDYPRDYHEGEGKCEDRSAEPIFKNTSMGEHDDISDSELKSLLTKHPVGAAVWMPGRMKAYHDGIITERDFFCSDPEKEVNHGVVIVGYGLNGGQFHDDCEEFWWVRNSWGQTWGQNGFFRLCMEHGEEMPNGTCQINAYATWPIL